MLKTVTLLPIALDVCSYNIIFPVCSGLKDNFDTVESNHGDELSKLGPQQACKKIEKTYAAC